MKYTIKKGHHYAWPMFTRPMRLDKQRTYEVIFSDECFEAYTDEAGAVNKLFGWTDGLALNGIHKNSRRVGWRANQDETITTFLYSYIDGKLTKTERITVNKSTCITYKINPDKGEFLKGTKHKWGWWLSPYFGGVLPSPCKCTITINRIK